MTAPPHPPGNPAASAPNHPVFAVCWKVGPDGTMRHLHPVSGYKLIRLLIRIHREDRRTLFSLLSKAKTGARLVLDLRCTRPQLGKGWVRLTVHGEPDGDGYRYDGLAVDITDLKMIEKQLQDRQTSLSSSLVELQRTQGKLLAQSEILMDTTHELEMAREEAEKASQVKSEFLSNMSHELRTPLNAIIGFSQIIREQTFGPVGSGQYRDYANDIYESGLHLLELINEVLDYSKIEAGAAKLLEDDVDVEAVAGAVTRMLADRAGNRGVALEIDAADGLPLLRADSLKVRQILINLLTNAIKFTNEGGSVTISLWAKSDSGFVLQVTDTGIGIALEDIPKALDMFGQVDSSLSRHHEGTGLGLPLTKSLAEMHGGSFDLQSKPGVGTTVTLRFPAERIVGGAESVSIDPGKRFTVIE